MLPKMNFCKSERLEMCNWAFVLSRIQNNLNEPQHGLYLLNIFEKVRNNRKGQN